MKRTFLRAVAVALATGLSSSAQAATVSNPFIWADIPDLSMIRVGSNYYMVHTTMHFAPGVPIMKSTDLVNWRIVNFAYQTLTNSDAMNLNAGKNAYGKGSWASSIRYKDGTYYVLTPSYTTGKTHLYSTKDIEKGPWKEVLLPFYHDPSLFLDDDGRNYVVYGAGDIRVVELAADLSGVKSGGVNKLLYNNVAAPTGGTSSLGEGSHVVKKNGYYYIFNICWPSGMPRSETVRRGKSIEGPFEAKTVMKSSGGYDGVAQGSVIQREDGSWMAYLFTDQGPVGRCPWMMPVTWTDDWPVFNDGVNAPKTFTVPGSAIVVPGYGVVTSDEFSDSKMKPEWQWNHNPDNANWSLTARPGYYQIKTSRTDRSILSAKNTLTHRTFGPKSSGRVALDASGLKDGDFAGLAILQDSLGFVGVKNNGGALSVVQYLGNTQKASVDITQKRVYFRIDFDVQNGANKSYFYYSTDSLNWKAIGSTRSMSYTLGMFVGYRFGLFAYSTKSPGGVADFDWFKIGATVNDVVDLYESNTAIGARDVGKNTPSGMRCQIRGSGTLDVLFELAKPAHASLTLHDGAGRRIKALGEWDLGAGNESKSLSLEGIGRGRYFVRARLDGRDIESKTIVLVR